jgi:hypothetical protein
VTTLHSAAIAAFIVLNAQPLVAQELSRYRDFALESSVAEIVKTSGARESDLKTLHVRPAKVQEITWRAPYTNSGTALADPVRDVLFSFYDDQLYRIVVNYERERMEGLTNDDVIESISEKYGVPLLRHAHKSVRPAIVDVLGDASILAQWDNTVSLVTLTQASYSSQFQLVLVSKSLEARARTAIKEALRLDGVEAPQREIDQRTKEVADARAASQKARVINKAAFRP